MSQIAVRQDAEREDAGRGAPRALLLVEPDAGERTERLRTLLDGMQTSGQLDLVAAGSPDDLNALDDLDDLDAPAVLIADVRRGPLTLDQEAAICAFVRRGGGLVCLGVTVEAWRENAALQAAIGPLAGRRTPTTELIVRACGDHDLTRRLDPTFPLRDSCVPLEAVPDDARVVLEVRWQYTTLPVAYVRPWGDGQVFVMSLGAEDTTLAHPVLRQILFRAIRLVAGWREAPPVRMALLGYGAIGREHGAALRDTPGLELALVCDRSPARLAAAQEEFPGVDVTPDLEAVTSDPAIGAVIVGTPPNTHAPLARALLLAGKHVVIEKPFCMTTTEADALIALADERHLTLTVYQNRRWDADFRTIQRVVASGDIGEVFHVETFIGGFAHPCDFWHSHEPISGGVFYDWGSHYLDWVLTLLPGAVGDVRASAHKRVWHDVTNADQATLAIRFADGREATFIHSDVAALLKPKWYILGTEGAIVADWRRETVASRAWSGDLIEAHLAPAEAPPVVTLARRGRDGGISEERLSLPPALVHPFHRNLADHLLAGESLAVRPEASRRTIAIMEAAAHSAAHDAAVVPIAPEYA